MRRDFDLIRRILAYMEDQTEMEQFSGGYDETVKEFEVDVKTLAFHVDLLLDAKYIDAAVNRARGSCAVVLRRITWGGCEFIEAAKNDGVWSKAKEALKKHITSYPLDVLQRVMNKIILEMVWPA